MPSATFCRSPLRIPPSPPSHVIQRSELGGRHLACLLPRHHHQKPRGMLSPPPLLYDLLHHGRSTLVARRITIEHKVYPWSSRLPFSCCHICCRDTKLENVLLLLGQMHVSRNDLSPSPIHSRSHCRFSSLCTSTDGPPSFNIYNIEYCDHQLHLRGVPNV